MKSDPIGGPLKDQVAGVLAALERHLVRPTVPTAQTTAVQRFAACTWVRRPRPGVDRMSSAWLIRTFIDPEARFVFADQPEPDQVAYDMYAGDFTHQGEACTFEVLVRRFRIADAAVRRIAEVVHDLDLNDAKYLHPEAQTIGLLVEGVRESQPDDRRALEVGISIFAAFHQGVTAGGTQGSSPRRSRLKPKGPAPAKR